MLEAKTGNLDSFRTYADVRDAVKAYSMLVTVVSKVGEYYKIGGVYTCTVGECLDYLLSLSPMKNVIKVVTDPNRLRTFDVDLQVMNCRKFKEHIGWSRKFVLSKLCRTGTVFDLYGEWKRTVK